MAKLLVGGGREDFFSDLEVSSEEEKEEDWNTWSKVDQEKEKEANLEKEEEAEMKEDDQWYAEVERKRQAVASVATEHTGEVITLGGTRSSQAIHSYMRAISECSSWRAEMKQRKARVWSDPEDERVLASFEESRGAATSPTEHVSKLATSQVRSAGGSLYAKGKVGGRTRWVLIDHGSSINLMREDVLQALIKDMTTEALWQLEVDTTPLTVRVANNKRWTLRKSVVLTVWLDKVPVTGRYWITSDMNDDVLLGLHTIIDARTQTNTYPEDEGGCYFAFKNRSDIVKLYRQKGTLTSGGCYFLQPTYQRIEPSRTILQVHGVWLSGRVGVSSVTPPCCPPPMGRHQSVPFCHLV